MKTSGVKSLIWLGIVVLSLGNTALLGQTESGSVRPLLQPIQVHKEDPAAENTLVKKTGSSLPTAAAPAPLAASGTGLRTSISILRDIEIPGNSGVLIESLDGKIVVESGSETPLNPASNVKVATTYAVLKAFGPDYRFPTTVWTDGAYDEANQKIIGNLYISGRDPVFMYEHSVALAQELNRMGVRTIEGDLIVTDNFTMNYGMSPMAAAKTIAASLDATKRSATVSKSWADYLVHSGKLAAQKGIPSVTITGSPYVQPLPTNAKTLFTHESAPMREIIKAMMSYSNNELSHRLGDMVGGPFGVANMVRQNTGTLPNEFHIATTSGLGINRVTPRAMIKLLRVLREELGRYKMTFADVMPVAGMDQGTLEGRFDTDFSRGSVIGKTGTLGNTDGGASALAGELNTRNGKYLFVIFNQRGSVNRFRSFQNYYVSMVQGALGGPAPIQYTEASMGARLAKSRITYPDVRTRGN
jgi:D-alanyl-D-alanine carboxypeptidase/D-alanyl-D-alanine-endopeptidase (penicillin-binding protein 4)